MFDDFVVGALLGQHEMAVDATLLSDWLKIFPDDSVREAEGEASAIVPPGFVAIVSMRSYASVVAPRPPGNLHGTQSYKVERLPRIGEKLSTMVHVAAKEIRRDRRWVSFRTETRDGTGSLCFSGLTTIAWSA